MTPLPLDPTLLCREAETWAARLNRDASLFENMGGAITVRCPDAHALASLLTQLSTLARAAGART